MKVWQNCKSQRKFSYHQKERASRLSSFHFKTVYFVTRSTERSETLGGPGHHHSFSWPAVALFTSVCLLCTADDAVDFRITRKVRISFMCVANSLRFRQLTTLSADATEAWLIAVSSILLRFNACVRFRRLNQRLSLSGFCGYFIDVVMWWWNYALWLSERRSKVS